MTSFHPQFVIDGCAVWCSVGVASLAIANCEGRIVTEIHKLRHTQTFIAAFCEYRYNLPIIAFFQTLKRAFFGTPITPEIMSAAKSKAQKIIDENAVAVFSKSYCPYCRATKSLLSEKHAKYYVIELDQVGK